MDDAIPFHIGDRVEARWQGGAYYPGRIAAVRGEGVRFDIDFDDGDHEDSVPVASIVRLPANGAKADWERAERIDRAQDATGAEIAVGDAVLARFERGMFAYPGRVEAIGEIDGCVGFTVAYDDGDREVGVRASDVVAKGGTFPGEAPARLPPADLFARGRALSHCSDAAGARLVPGAAVEARWLRGVEFYPGIVAGIVQAPGDGGDGDWSGPVLLSIAYDDGDREDGVLEADVRAVEDAPQGPAAMPRKVLPPGAIPLLHGVDRCGRALAVGDTVTADWLGGGVSYPGRVAAVYELQAPPAGALTAHGVPPQAAPALRFDIAYDDGDFEAAVPSTRVTRVGGDTMDVEED